MCDNEIVKADIVIKLIMQCKREFLFSQMFMSLSRWVGLLFSLLFSCAAGMSGCGCRSSTQTFPRVPKWPSQCGTSMALAKPSLLEEPLSPCLANMGESNLSSLFVVSYLFLYSSSQGIKKATRTQTPEKTPHDKPSNCLLPVCSVKVCTTWKFGQVWRVTEGNPPPHLDVPAAAWQRTRWADLQKYSTI